MHTNAHIMFGLDDLGIAYYSAISFLTRGFVDYCRKQFSFFCACSYFVCKIYVHVLIDVV